MESTKAVNSLEERKAPLERTDTHPTHSVQADQTSYEPTNLSTLSTRASTVKALFEYISHKRLWGMVVLLSVLLLVSIVVITAEAFTYLAPFVYAIF